jgi:hypothetical protein
MDQKTMAIVVIAVVIVAVIGVAAYWILSSGETGEPEPTPTPTPAGIEGASSLQYSVDITGGVSEGSYIFYGKNIGTDDLMIRVECAYGEMTLIYIVNGAEQKAWADEGAGWVDLSDTFSDQWDAWQPTWQVYTDELATWTEGEWTYTDAEGAEVRIYDITVNPSLEDSLFAAET